jgi:hypothetical protein
MSQELPLEQYGNIRGGHSGTNNKNTDNVGSRKD